MNKLTIDKNDVGNTYMVHLLSDLGIYDEYFNKFPGEHYRLLANISLYLPANTIVSDVGSYRGMSALALTYSPTIKVNSYCIEGAMLPEIRNHSRINYIQDRWGNNIDAICSTPFIFFDTSHDGVQEPLFIEELLRRSYKGVVLFDDIHLHEAMQNFWDNIQLEKYDLTDVGHASGTGLVCFNTEVEII